MSRKSAKNGFTKKSVTGNPDGAGVFLYRHFLLSSFAWLAVFLLLVAIISDAFPLSAALLRLTPGGTPPVSGIYVSRSYEAQPNERGSVLLQAAQAFINLEGMSLSIAVDPLRAEILRVRRTAATQQFDISLEYPSAGIVRVSFAGPPRTISAGTHLLEIELNLKGSSVNRAGHRIDVRLLGAQTSSNGSTIGSVASDGLITFTTNQDALSLPFTPAIADVKPGILPLVRAQKLIIRGQAFSASPRVLLGSRSIPVVSASSTEIVATIPEDTQPGVYTVAVESLLAEERVVVFGAAGPAGSVDILDELLFVDPNPILYTASNESGNLSLWIPVYNPLGSTDSVSGSVDLSAIGGDPNVTFSGIGTVSIGPSGQKINWFRIPASGQFSLPKGLETDVDYPVTVRVENRAGTLDTAIASVSLRSRILGGSSPSFGMIETNPRAAVPGETVTFFVDVSDPEGVDSIALVTLRLSSIGGAVQTMEPAMDIPASPLFYTIPYSTDFSVPESVVPGSYELTLRALDKSGNETVRTFTYTIAAPGGDQRGQAPQFSGRLQARPSALGPGGTVDFFVGARDPDGTETIDIVTIDLVDIGGGAEEMTPAVAGTNLGTLPLTYQATFELPSKLADGTYNLKVRAVDRNGLSAETTLPLTIDASLGGGGTEGSPPEFFGRKEVMPVPVALGGLVKFFIQVRDTDGSESIERVMVDLVDVGGTELELKPALGAVSGSVEPVLYIGEFKIPANKPPGIYTLTVRAFDDAGNAARTTIPVTVSAVAVASSAPVILQALSVPAQVPADDETEVLFRIEAEDPDGFADIAIARINLTAIGRGITLLQPQRNLSAQGSTRGFFESGEITIPTFVKSAGYDLPVELEDKQGNRVQRMLRLIVGPAIGGDAPAFRETRFVPETARPGGDVRLYAEVEDLNGADADKLTIVADFTEVRREIEELEDLINFPSGTLITRTTFASDTITLPDDLPVGVYDVPLMVVDDTNNVIRTIARLRVETGAANEGQEPHISAERTFQVPRLFANDGGGGGELHVLVQDPDDDVLTVMVNMGSVGSANSASVRADDTGIELLCRSSSALVCMERGALESVGSRWFVLKDIEIPETTIAGNDPYILEITAIDAAGHTVEGRIPLKVGTPDDADALAVEPAFNLIVPVSATQLELVLSSPVDALKVDRSGKQFIIRSALDAFSTRMVQRVSWDTMGRFLYLQTDALTPGETYILSVENRLDGTVPPLTDARGNRFASDRGGKISFTYEEPSGNEPVIDRVTVLDAEHINVHFKESILPSSVHPDLLFARSSLVSVVSGESRSIRGGVLTEGGKILKLTVDALREGDRYRLRIAGVLARGLIEAPAPGVEKIFVALFPKHDAAGGRIFPTADLNHDGRVDFADFVLFSAVYNTEYSMKDAAELHDAASEEEEEERGSGTFGAQNNPKKNSSQTFGGELPKFSY